MSGRRLIDDEGAPASLLRAALGDAPGDAAREQTLQALGLVGVPAPAPASGALSGLATGAAGKLALALVLAGSLRGDPAGSRPVALAQAPALPALPALPAPPGVPVAKGATSATSAPPRAALQGRGAQLLPHAIDHLGPTMIPGDNSKKKRHSVPAATSVARRHVVPAASVTAVPALAALAPGQGPPGQAGCALEAELTRLEAARSWAASAPRLALASLSDYERACPSGALRLEASVLRAEALVAAGEPGQAAALAARLLERAPGGIHARRLQAIVSGAGSK
jgi:hypothetical protein